MMQNKHEWYIDKYRHAASNALSTYRSHCLNCGVIHIGNRLSRMHFCNSCGYYVRDQHICDPADQECPPVPLDTP